MYRDSEHDAAARSEAPPGSVNPFAPIDVASRLKAPHPEAASRRMPPLQPGQLYGTDRRMSPPKPLPSRSEPVEAPARAVPPGMSAPAGLPPYLQRRAPVGQSAVPPPAPDSRVDLYSAPPQASTAPAAAPSSFMEPAREAASEAAPPRRRSRVARHAAQEPPVRREAIPQPASEAQPTAEALPPLPEAPFASSWPPPPQPEAFVPGGEPGEPYAPALKPGAPYPSAAPPPYPQLPMWPFAPDDGARAAQPAEWDSAPFAQWSRPVDEVAAFFAGDFPSPMPEDASAPPAEEPSAQPQAFDFSSPEAPFDAPEPAPYAVSPLRDPFTPAGRFPADAEEPPREAPAFAPPPAVSQDAPPVQTAPPSDRPARPPVRPARVAALIAAFVMLAFCAIEGGRILSDLSRNERQMEDLRADFRERTGIDLQNGAARVDLLPAGQTFAPTAAPQTTPPVQTPSPTPVIPIRENAVQSLNKRDTSLVQETAVPSDTPAPRTRLTEYPGNPLKNVVESLQPLIAQNGDVVGKLTIPGVLEEVVVQRNNTYYLTHSYQGWSSAAGAVFADESCSLRYPPENLLLRGQSNVPGKTFAPLLQYATAGRDFVASATTATLTTLYEEADYVLFAVIVADSDPASEGYFNYASHPTFATDESMLSYVESARAHSLYPFSVDVQASDRLLTLATIGSGSDCVVLLFRQAR